MMKISKLNRQGEADSREYFKGGNILRSITASGKTVKVVTMSVSHRDGSSRDRGTLQRQANAFESDRGRTLRDAGSLIDDTDHGDSKERRRFRLAYSFVIPNYNLILGNRMCTEFVLPFADGSETGSGYIAQYSDGQYGSKGNGPVNPSASGGRSKGSIAGPLRPNGVLLGG